jgi:hypothetical protein
MMKLLVLKKTKEETFSVEHATPAPSCWEMRWLVLDVVVADVQNTQNT